MRLALASDPNSSQELGASWIVRIREYATELIGASDATVYWNASAKPMHFSGF
jgi:hypothetical protein